uniref:Integrator complex subunit 4 n=1 Tax=Timema poppense TaxID=170557 RepID=A0A7R9CSV4_TIMPO|nr:unnamed protein product [Timema poppensis]
MAAVLKKRALAEYSQTIQEEPPKPVKKLRLVKKLTLGNSAIVYIGLLEKSKSSNDALQVLVRIADCLKFEYEVVSTVRAKILALFADISKEQGADIPSITEELISLLKKEESHKVLAQGVSALLKIGRLQPDNQGLHQKIVQVAIQRLKDTSHLVKCTSLELIGDLLPVGATVETSPGSIMRLVGDYTHSDEGRVRSAAFRAMMTLHGRGLTLDPSVYSEACLALKDDYEIVRQEALRLVWVLGRTYPENIIVLPSSDEEVRLVDDAFGKLCNMINDLSMNVRTLAAEKLGSMTLVSPKFLHQTLDKKLMSNMRKKRSAHERAWESITSGEWASGKNWSDDAPREVIDAESVSLMSSGSCGAFVHGLEDEFLEVRYASVESVCQLSLDNPQFAHMSLDFLVDMFNDEIEEVRIKAIDSLTRISRHIVLREDQLETILGALKDFSMDVREGLHKMLASCRLSSKNCLQMCVESLLENLKKYPMDRRSTWHCLQKIGQSHPELTLPLVPELLAIHPFFDTPEPDVEDPACILHSHTLWFNVCELELEQFYNIQHLYVCILILVFNAAQQSPTMLQLFEEHTLKHYSYLRDTMPTLVPALKSYEPPIILTRAVCSQLVGSSRPADPAPLSTGSAQYLSDILARIETAPSSCVRRELMEACRHDLSRLATIDRAIPGALQFSALYISSQLLMIDILSNKLWSNPSALASQQGNVVKNCISQLLSQCLKLQHLYVGLNTEDLSCVKQFKLKALALQLVYIVRGSNFSALALCEHFLETVEDTQRYLSEHEVQPEAFTSSLFKELGLLEDTKPGPVARCLLPLLQVSTPAPLPHTNIEVERKLKGVGESNSNAAVERSFSIIKECLVENLHEDGLIAQYVTYDAVTAAGGLINMTISKKMIYAVRDAPGIRKEVLDKKKKIEIDLSQKRKTASEEIRKLEVKRRTVLQKAKEEEEIRSSMAVISEPTGDLETALKFTAGLVLGVHCDALLHNIQDISTLRIKVKYPDQQTHLLVPRPTDLRPLEPPDHRLLTTILLSHHVWTEACIVEVSLALDVARAESGLAGRKVLSSGSMRSDDPWVLDLCRPVKVLVSPKPIKRGI